MTTKMMSLRQKKKISEITSTDKDGYKNSYKNFSYDKEGRVISYRWEDNATTLDVTYTYEKDKITRKEVEKGNDYTENIDAVYVLNEKVLLYLKQAITKQLLIITIN